MSDTIVTAIVTHDGKLVIVQPAGKLVGTVVNGNNEQPKLLFVKLNVTGTVVADAQFSIVITGDTVSVGAWNVQPRISIEAVAAVVSMLFTVNDKSFAGKFKYWPADSLVTSFVLPEFQRCKYTTFAQPLGSALSYTPVAVRNDTHSDSLSDGRVSWINANADAALPTTDADFKLIVPVGFKPMFAALNQPIS